MIKLPFVNIGYNFNYSVTSIYVTFSRFLAYFAVQLFIRDKLRIFHSKLNFVADK